MDKSPAIITGIGGWLGNRFLHALTKGLSDAPFIYQSCDRRIYALTKARTSENSADLINNSTVKFVTGDLQNKESLRPLFKEAEGATVFHIAGLIHPRFVSELYGVNVMGTDNMLEMAKEYGVRRFIYVSSNSAFGVNANRNDCFDETSPYHPYLNYGKSKMLAEQLVLKYANQLETVILRPPWFYGPEQPARQSLFFKMIRTGKVPLVGDGLNKRSMVYIDNLCQALFLAESIESAKGQIYWIADRKPYTMKEVINTIENVLERDFKIPVAHKHLQLPNFASNFAYLADKSIQSLGLYNQKVHVLSEFNKTIACRIEKAEKELGYIPHVSLEEGMRRSIEWLLQRRIEF